MDTKLLIIALAPHGEGISGGDRIFIELARNLSRKLHVSIHTWSEGMAMIKRQRLRASKHLQLVEHKFFGLTQGGNFFLNYILRIILAIKLGFSHNISNKVYLYSASEFWMDVFAAAILKLRYPKKLVWIATWYQTAPSPLKGFTEGESRQDNFRLNAIAYWIVQQPSKLLINIFADKVVVNNEDEVGRFSSFQRKNIFVMIGSVPLKKINSYLGKSKKVKKEYEAVFQGRFHAQKGVVELIDIWKYVARQIPEAKLAMVGDGPLRERIEKRIKKYGLSNNIKLFGYLNDGRKKFSVFHRSKIVVHPAFYDSGGMASAEAMAFGLPCVGFDLKAYKSYYPKGMLKVEKNNLEQFAMAVVDLIKNAKKRKKIGLEAKKLIFEEYSWEKRSEQFLIFVKDGKQ